jgi:hypothetical protein
MRYSGWLLFSTPQRMALVFFLFPCPFHNVTSRTVWCGGWLLFYLFSYPSHNVTSRIVWCGGWLLLSLFPYPSPWHHVLCDAVPMTKFIRNNWDLRHIHVNILIQTQLYNMPPTHKLCNRIGSQAQIWLRGLDYCPLTGHKPGLLLACLLDIIPWGNIYISWDYVMTPCAGNVVLRRKPQSTFCVSARL